MTDDERETQIREYCEKFDRLNNEAIATGRSGWWTGDTMTTLDGIFLLRLLNEARAEIARRRAGGISLGPRQKRVPFVVDEPIEERDQPGADDECKASICRAPPSVAAIEAALIVVEAASAEWASNSGGNPSYPLPSKNVVMREHIARAIAQAAIAAREEEREFLLGSLLRPDMDDMMAMSRAWESAGGEWSTWASVYMCAALATLARALGQRKPG